MNISKTYGIVHNGFFPDNVHSGRHPFGCNVILKNDFISSLLDFVKKKIQSFFAPLIVNRFKAQMTTKAKSR